MLYCWLLWLVLVRIGSGDANSLVMSRDLIVEVNSVLGVELVLAEFAPVRACVRDAVVGTGVGV